MEDTIISSYTIVSQGEKKARNTRNILVNISTLYLKTLLGKRHYKETAEVSEYIFKT